MKTSEKSTTITWPDLGPLQQKGTGGFEGKVSPGPASEVITGISDKWGQDDQTRQDNLVPGK
jgi:hypothetical protein